MQAAVTDSLLPIPRSSRLMGRVLVAGVSERSTSRPPRGYLVPRTAPQTTTLLHAQLSVFLSFPMARST
jgi:hypothetical protein